VERLARSIETSGQLVACIGMGGAERVVRIDDDRRVAALRPSASLWLTGNSVPVTT
jgi:hypothetical protein